MPDDVDALADGALASRIAAAGRKSIRSPNQCSTGDWRRACGSTGCATCATPHAAHDLVQQVLLMTLERLRAGKLREPERIASFVLGMCRMVVLEIRRGAWRRQTLLETYGDTPEAVEMPEPLALDADKLAGCLQTLAERERTVVVMTFFADKTSDEVAKTLALVGRQRARHPPPRAGAAARLHGRGGVMTRPRCAAPIELAVLAAYWVGELPEAEEAAVEEHLLGCGSARGGSSSSPPWRLAYAWRYAGGAVQAVITPTLPRAHEAAGHAHPRIPALAPGERWPARSARRTMLWSAACRRRSRASSAWMRCRASTWATAARSSGGWTTCLSIRRADEVISLPSARRWESCPRIRSGSDWSRWTRPASIARRLHVCAYAELCTSHCQSGGVHRLHPATRNLAPNKRGPVVPTFRKADR